MAKRPEDYELNFLHDSTKEELEPLVGIILGTDKAGNINLNGRVFSSELQKTNNFKLYYPDHTKYVDEIIEEIQKYGGSSVVNALRKCGVTYHEILCDVCGKLKVTYDKLQSTETIEEALLSKVIQDMWEKMSEEDRKKVLDELGGGQIKFGGLTDAAIIAILRAGGFKVYQLMFILVNAISKIILGRGLPFVAGPILAKTMAFLIGPVGWVVAGIWTALDIAAPAYRVTVPAVVYIAALRKMKKEVTNLSEEEMREVGFPLAKNICEA